MPRNTAMNTNSRQGDLSFENHLPIFMDLELYQGAG